MFALFHFLNALASVLDGVFTLMFWAVVLRAVLSWVNPDPYHPLVKFLDAVTEPLLRPFRRVLPPWKTGGVDVSPLFAILALQLLELFLIPSLRDLALQFR